MNQPTRRRGRFAFTLIELLVVVAIISILAATLFPVFAQSKAAAKQSVCVNHLREVGLAGIMYAGDFDDIYPPVTTYERPINGGGSWERPFDTMIAPYVRNENLFRCPMDTSSWPGLPKTKWWDGNLWNIRGKRSYGIIGNIYTVEGGSKAPDQNTGICIGPPGKGATGRSMGQFDDTANTLSLTEVFINLLQKPDSWVGEASGSGFIDCDAGKLPGRKYPAAGPLDSLPCPGTFDYAYQPQPYHTGGENFAFVDGHAKLLNFAQVRRDDFLMFKAQKPSQQFFP
jgi:prepilin-type N-terminal cleavage/methylation domain-containing protein/prepilin-type processing-associated H-X9-DG protein